MISIDGAGLLAQVIPVAVLVLALEIRKVQPLYGANRAGTVLLWSMGVGLFVTVLLSFQAEIMCVTAVSSGVAIDGFGAVFIWIACTALWVATFLLLALIIADALGFLDWIGRQAASRVLRHPEAALRAIEYINERHPESEKLGEEAMRALRALADDELSRREKGD